MVSLNPELFYTDAVVLNDLEMAHERYKQGERDSIVDTLMICAKYQAVIPDWLANELIEIEFKIRSGEVKPQSGTVDLRSADCISSLALSSLSRIGKLELYTRCADPSNSIKINCTSELNPRPEDRQRLRMFKAKN